MGGSPSSAGRPSETWSDPMDTESGLASEALVRTKLYIPQVQSNWVVRPRLIELLNGGLECSLVLVSAPPGFGKTTLLSEWAAAGVKDAGGKSLPVAWLSLDDRDNDPARFAAYLLAALAKPGIRLGEIDGLGLEKPYRGSLEKFLTRLVNAIAAASENPASPLHAGFVLILDDYHRITGQALQESVAFLLAHQPSSMHLVIASRVDPALPLAQLRARGQLVELRANDLRFTAQEIKEFLNQKMVLNLPAEALSILDARTEGWAAGLHLAALSMRDRRDRDAFIQEFNGSHRYIVDYLAEQVLSQQPEPVQAFLLQTSVLDRLSGPLCDAIRKDEGGRRKDESSAAGIASERMKDESDFILHPSSFILDYLERSNLFLVPLDDRRQWFRYHPLLADFLRQRLRQSQPERWPELHRRAAEYYERNGFPAEAVDHILAVGDARQASRLVEQIAEAIWMSGAMIRLLGWLEALPDEIIRSRPRLCIYYAWILNILGEFEARDTRLQDAAQGLGQTRGESPANQALTRGMLAATQAIIAVMEGRAETASHLSQLALKELPEENWVWRSVAVRNLGNAYLLQGQTTAASQAFLEAFQASRRAGSIYMALVALYELAELQIVQGQLHRAARTCRRALELAEAEKLPGLNITGAVHVGLSEVLRQWNDLEGGMRHALLGIHNGQQGKSLGVQVCGYTRLALLAQARGDAQAADRAFQKAAELAPFRRRTSFLAHHDIQASLWGRQGNIDLAVHWAQENDLLNGLEPSGEVDYMNESANITLVRVFLQNGRAAEAERFAERLRRAAEKAGRVGRLIEILVLLAQARWEQGRQRLALDTLRQALALAEPEGYVRLFLDEGERMRQMLAQAGRLWGQAPLRQYVRRLLAAFGGTGSSGQNLHLSRPVHLPADRVPFEHAPWQSDPVSNPVPKPEGPIEPLSEREVEILHLVAAGLSNQEVARSLVVAPSTVHWHIKNIYSKLDVHSRTQAVARAVEMGLLKWGLSRTPTSPLFRG